MADNASYHESLFMPLLPCGCGGKADFDKKGTHRIFCTVPGCPAISQANDGDSAVNQWNKLSSPAH